MEFALSELKPYNACEVARIEDGALRAKLSRYGITPGAELTWLFDAPCGDPAAYAVRGSVVAIRSSDASRIIVRTLGAE